MGLRELDVTNVTNVTNFTNFSNVTNIANVQVYKKGHVLQCAAQCNFKQEQGTTCNGFK